MKKQMIAWGVMLGFAASLSNATEVDSYSNGDYDLKYYAAAGCGSKNNAVTVGKSGGIFNTSGTANNDITCPTILDRFYNNNRSFYLATFRAPGAQAMVCYLNTGDGVSTTTTTQPAPFGDTTLAFNRNSSIVVAAVGCTVPKKASNVQSGIKRYYVQEF